VNFIVGNNKKERKTKPNRAGRRPPKKERKKGAEDRVKDLIGSRTRRKHPLWTTTGVGVQREKGMAALEVLPKPQVLLRPAVNPGWQLSVEVARKRATLSVCLSW
jgi:hypothetical protein